MRWVLFVHVALGAVWLGGVMYQEALAAGARKLGRDSFIRTVVQAQVTNARIYPVVTILLLLSAIWLIVAGAELEFSDLWISISFAIWVVAVATGIFYFTAKSKEMSAQLEAEGPSDELLETVERVHFVERLEIILLLGLLLLMVFKPGA